MSKTYNGWTNYETWNVKLWIDNDGSIDDWTYVAEELLHRNTPEEAGYQLAARMEQEFKEQMPDLGASCWMDLLNAALGEVNWREIAESMIDQAKRDLEAA